MGHFHERFRAYVASFEAALNAELPALCGVAPLSNAVCYSLSSGGKRIRPVLALATCEAFGGSQNGVLPFALAVEYLHTSSLIHDDLPCLDNDTMRRGRPTCHVQYGEAVALLAGDFLIAKAFEAAGSAGDPGISNDTRLLWLRLLAEATAGLCEGQALDIGGVLSAGSTEEPLIELHRRKTGALFRAITVGGAAAAGIGGRTLESVASFGDHLGLLFQVTDDLLDAPDLSRNTSIDRTRETKEGEAARDAVSALGLEGTVRLASRVAEQARAALSEFHAPEFLGELIDEVRTRTR